MMKGNNTGRALFSSMLSLLLCCTMLFGTTLAWFSDSADSGSNVIMSGNLDMDVQYTLDGVTWKPLDGAVDLFQKGLWEPGHTEIVVLKIENTGSLALQYAANINTVAEIPGQSREGDPIVLSQILTVSTLHQTADAFDPAAPFTGENGVTYARTDVFENADVLQPDIPLKAGETHYLTVKVDMADNLGNEVNHNGVNIPKITFGVNVLATQTGAENDSFGNQYDAGASYPDPAEQNQSDTE